jgi:EmrB/QacA subfamily drug resistance transporter
VSQTDNLSDGTGSDGSGDAPVPPPGETLDETMLAPPVPATETAKATETGATDRDRRLVPMIIGIAMLIHTLDATVITNALPTMAREMHEDPVMLDLAITSYLLATAVFLPISAWIADRFGAKTVLRAAILCFGVSSLLCGLSQNLLELVGGRVLQGIAGAMLMPVGRLVILRSVPKSQLVQAMAYFTMPALVGPVIGPPLGGFIVTYWSWPWIFFINVPMALLGAILVSSFVPDIKAEVRERLDVRGFLLTACGLAGLVYGFNNLGHDALPPTVVAAMLIGGAICLAFYIPHARRTPNAILDLSLLKIPSFAAASYGGLFSRFSIGAIPFLMALLLQLGFGLSAFAAGMLTFAGAVGAITMKSAAPPIIRRLGFRTVLIGNTFLVALLSGGNGFIRPGTPHALLMLWLLLGGFFRSLQFTALNTFGYAEVTTPQMSRASSMATMFQQVAQSLGVALSAIVVHYTLVWNGNRPLDATSMTPAFFLIGALSLGGLYFFVPLAPDAGAEVSGRRLASARR